MVLYISMSLDGYVAGKGDDISFLDAADKEGLDYNYPMMQERCDAYLVGKRTYDVVMGLTGGEFMQTQLYKDVYVITRTEREPENGVQFFAGHPADLIEELIQHEGKDIYCDGGGTIVRLLLERGMIDEFIITVFPTLLGGGIPLFPPGFDRTQLELVTTESFETGLVQLRYNRK